MANVKEAVEFVPSLRVARFRGLASSNLADAIWRTLAH